MCSRQRLISKQATLLTACLVLSACAGTTTPHSTDTDSFVRNALDAYGVVDVVPSTSYSVATNYQSAQTAESKPESVRQTKQMTLAEACEGKTGIQYRLINAETRKPIDCGPSADTVPTS